jgi:Zn finger protein HypA/HybF involved in hydrogenase expression
MSFEVAPKNLRCIECQSEITLEQYRRKVPRCDDCEVAQFRRQLGNGHSALRVAQAGQPGAVSFGEWEGEAS